MFLKKKKKGVFPFLMCVHIFFGTLCIFTKNACTAVMFMCVFIYIFFFFGEGKVPILTSRFLYGLPDVLQVSPDCSLDVVAYVTYTVSHTEVVKKRDPEGRVRRLINLVFESLPQMV